MNLYGDRLWGIFGDGCEWCAATTAHDFIGQLVYVTFRKSEFVSWLNQIVVSHNPSPQGHISTINYFQGAIFGKC